MKTNEVSKRCGVFLFDGHRGNTNSVTDECERVKVRKSMQMIINDEAAKYT